MEGGGVEEQPYLSGSSRKDDAVSLVLVVAVLSQMIHKDDERLDVKRPPSSFIQSWLTPNV